MSIAVDTQGAEAARPWAAGTDAAFPTVVDSENCLAQLYDYKLIPNGIFLDENGVIRYRKFGGFNVENADDAGAIQRLIDGEEAQIDADSSVAPYRLGATERELVETGMRLGAESFTCARLAVSIEPDLTSLPIFSDSSPSCIRAIALQSAGTVVPGFSTTKLPRP